MISLRLILVPKFFRRGWVKLKVRVLLKRGLIVWNFWLESYLEEAREIEKFPPVGINCESWVE